jgi:uncharacterized protein DUF7002
MAFTLDQYAELRPFLYHVTARENLARLRRFGRLETASAILRGAGREDLLRARRPSSVTIGVGGDSIVLKDQHPLVAANVTLVSGWDFDDFVEYLNDHVYFWPGDAIRMFGPAGRLLAHYAPESPLVLRVPFAPLVAANSDLTPLFSPYNSGAPRMQSGKGVKRDPDLFRPAEQFRRRPHEVVEVAFRGSVALPADTAIAGEQQRWVPFGASM